MSFAAARVLGEVPPHGCCLSWPETISRVAVPPHGCGLS